MSNADTLATVASVIAGFGAAMLSFRLGREVTAQEEGEYSWIPWADALLIAAIFVSLLLVVFPIVTFRTLSGFAAKLPVAACSASCLLVAGYVLAILADYRLLFGRKRRGEGKNPEPTERWIVISTAVICLGLFVWLLI